VPFEQLAARLAESYSSRSTALKPLLWLDGLLLAATTASSRLPSTGVTSVIQIGCAAMAAVSVLVTILAYAWFMFKNPDYLRSEHFTLRKIAMEKGVFGDDLQGIVQIKSGRALAEPLSPTAIGHEERP
jgi:hypothetical protein